MFLSAAVSPRLQAASRWVAIDARSTRAFALSGKDSGSATLHWFAQGRPADGEGRLDAAARQLGVDRELPDDTFITWYRTLNRGYPFLDYSTEGALEADTRLMESYASQGASPGPVTPWRGDRQGLPPGRLETGGGAQPLSNELVAGWLRLAAGVTRIRRLSHSTVSHRTSPSGGARHPTDIGVRVGAGWSAEICGSWWYEPVEHALVAATAPHPVRDPGPSGVTFVVSSHVLRAMWRYRDVRALRPVLIDAGHVVETLLSVVEASGWTARWWPAAGLVDEAGGLDMVIGYVTAGPASEPGPVQHPLVGGHSTDLAAAVPDAGAVLRTNPMVSLAITGQQLVAQNHLRPGHHLAVSPAMVDAIAHATPSSRGDRPSDAASVCAVTGASPSEIDELVRAGMLLAERAGDTLWQKTRSWADHDWFLSLLAHSEEAGGIVDDERGPCPVMTRPATDLATALGNRRTCRSFTGEPLHDTLLERLLATVRSPADGVQVLVLLRHDLRSAGGAVMPRGMHVLEADEWRSSRLPEPSEEDVRRAAIGQPWAHGFAALFWLVPFPVGRSGGWEASLVDCGRLAQQLALAVSSESGVGVFQTPALIDDVLAGLLHEHSSADGAYLVGVGVAGDAIARSESLFRPSDIIRPVHEVTT